MNSSAYYQGLMEAFSSQIAEIDEKIFNCECSTNQLNHLSSSLNSPIDNLNSAESNFENGGYYVGEQTPANGKIKASAEELTVSQGDLDTLCSKVQKDLSDYQKEKTTLEQQYNEAYNNYLTALSNEMNSG